MEKKTRTVGEIKAYYTGLMLGNLTELSNIGDPEAVITDMIDRLTNDLMESMKQQQKPKARRGRVAKIDAATLGESKTGAGALELDKTDKIS